jgi:hypothetical protein
MKGAKVRRMWMEADAPHTIMSTKRAATRTYWKRGKKPSSGRLCYKFPHPVAVVDMRKEAFEALAKKILAEADKRVGEKYGVRGNYFNIEFTKAAISAVFGKVSRKP